MKKIYILLSFSFFTFISSISFAATTPPPPPINLDIVNYSDVSFLLKTSNVRNVSNTDTINNYTLQASSTKNFGLAKGDTDYESLTVSFIDTTTNANIFDWTFTTSSTGNPSGCNITPHVSGIASTDCTISGAFNSNTDPYTIHLTLYPPIKSQNKQ